MSSLRENKQFSNNDIKNFQCEEKYEEKCEKKIKKLSDKKNHEKILKRCPSDAPTIDFIKRGSFFQAIQGFISEYSNSTSIHGVKYLGARHQPWYERIFWLIVIGISVYICIILTLTTYTKWKNNPVIVSLAETSTPIWEIPFPTVTICPLAKSKRDKFAFDTFLENYLKYYEKGNNKTAISDEHLKYFDAISHVCLENSEILTKISFENYITEEPLTDILRNISPSLLDTFYSISWRKDPKYDDEEISPLIREIITEDGLCFSFNSFNDSEIFRDINNKPETNMKKTIWSLENGYAPEALADAYPRRVLAGDVDEGLDIKLQANSSDSDPECSGKSQGFKVILHTPGEFPQVTKRFFRVPFKQLLLVSIKPNMITTSTAVKAYDSSKRQCFFNNERYLRFFKVYTQGNCEHECIANATLKECGCLKISMPKIPGIPYCGAGSITCYVAARKNILKNEGYQRQCNCLPACTSIAYDAEVTQSILNQDSILFGNETIDKDTALSVMKVFFASNQFLSSKRSELYGIADLIANIGGLFGLFMGVSILSLVEIIYFSTIRLFTNLKMRHETRKKYKLATKFS